MVKVTYDEFTLRSIMFVAEHVYTRKVYRK